MFGFGKKKIDKAAWAVLVYSEPLKNPEKNLRISSRLLPQDC